MWIDPIVAEIRRHREDHAATYNYDLDAIYKAIKEDEEKSDHPKVSFEPKRIQAVPSEKRTVVA